MKKLKVTIFGATGQQGGSVYRELLKHPNQFEIRAVTRQRGSEKARRLAGDGVEVVQVDFENQESLCEALRGSDACFVVTVTDFNDPKCPDTETKQGRNIADACQKMGVDHIVFSTQLNIQKISGIFARHMVPKAEIEEYMKAIGLQVTSIIVPYYFENFLTTENPPGNPIKEGNNIYTLAIPVGTLSLDMISVWDIGEVVRQIFIQKPMYVHKTISICGDKLTVREIAQVFTKNFWPRQFKDKQITPDDLRNYGTPGSKDQANMFDFYSRVDQRSSMALTQQLNPRLHAFKDWLSENKQRFDFSA